MTKLKCYLAHPEKHKNDPMKILLVEELKSRRIEVIDPFDMEKPYLEEIGIKDYWECQGWKLARKIWTLDIGLVYKCDMLVGWIPDYESIGTSAEIAMAYVWKKFIQIISPIHHPMFSVYADQYFESIDDFIRRREYIWNE